MCKHLYAHQRVPAGARNCADWAILEQVARNIRKRPANTYEAVARRTMLDPAKNFIPAPCSALAIPPRPVIGLVGGCVCKRNCGRAREPQHKLRQWSCEQFFCFFARNAFSGSRNFDQLPCVNHVLEHSNPPLTRLFGLRVLRGAFSFGACSFSGRLAPQRKVARSPCAAGSPRRCSSGAHPTAMGRWQPWPR